MAGDARVRRAATKADGTPCAAWATRDSGLCIAHAGGNGRLGRSGERARISDDTIEAIATAVSAGSTVGVAVQAAGISRSTFGLWLRRGITEPRSAYARLRERVQQARAEAQEARRVATIAKAAQVDWRASAWILERSAPERWARPCRRAPALADAAAEVDAEFEPQLRSRHIVGPAAAQTRLREQLGLEPSDPGAA